MKPAKAHSISFPRTYCTTDSCLGNNAFLELELRCNYLTIGVGGTVGKMDTERVEMTGKNIISAKIDVKFVARVRKRFFVPWVMAEHSSGWISTSILYLQLVDDVPFRRQRRLFMVCSYTQRTDSRYIQPTVDRRRFAIMCAIKKGGNIRTSSVVHAMVLVFWTA